MKRNFIFFLLFLMLMLTGCTRVSLPSAENMAEEDGTVLIGKHLAIKNTNTDLILLDNKGILAADGLYYATWVMGDAKSFENSDGDTVDLYDAQLYLLLQESPSGEKAQNNMDAWVNTEKSNYEIVSEEEIACNGQTYKLLTYNCQSKTNPYAHGLSAFGIYDKSAVCMELTCTENFEEDLKIILTDFLNSCTYNAD